MFKNLQKREKGFTIIEVLIVLAIAGLIMLVVFLAVPALQRNQRNNGRNSEASRVASAVTECLANRNGVPASCDSTAEVITGQLNQFTGISFSTVQATAPTPASSTTQAAVWYGKECDAAGAAAVNNSSPRSFVVLYTIEPTITRCIGA